MENVVNYSKKELFRLKMRKIFKNPKFYLKDFLVSLDIFDESVNIDEIFFGWNKKLILWIFSVIISGLLLNIPITLLLNHRFKWYTILSYGLLVYIITKTWRGYVNGRKEIAHARK